MRKKKKEKKFTTSRGSREVLAGNSPRTSPRGFGVKHAPDARAEEGYTTFCFLHNPRRDAADCLSARRAEGSSSQEPAGARPARGSRLTRRTAARRQGSGSGGAGFPALEIVSHIFWFNFLCVSSVFRPEKKKKSTRAHKMQTARVLLPNHLSWL